MVVGPQIQATQSKVWHPLYLTPLGLASSSWKSTNHFLDVHILIIKRSDYRQFFQAVLWKETFTKLRVNLISLSVLPVGKWCSPIVKFRTKLISYGITNVRVFSLHRLSLVSGGPPLWTQNPFLSISSAVSQPGIWVQWSNAPSALGPKQRFLLSRSGLSWGLQP